MSLRERQKQLCKSLRGGGLFLRGRRSTPEALSFLLFRVDKAEDSVKLCTWRERENGFLVTAFEREVKLLSKGRKR